MRKKNAGNVARRTKNKAREKKEKRKNRVSACDQIALEQPPPVTHVKILQKIANNAKELLRPSHVFSLDGVEVEHLSSEAATGIVVRPCSTMDKHVHPDPSVDMSLLDC